MSVHEAHVAALQSRVREALDDLRPVPPDSREYPAAAAAVLQATAELIEYEERLPFLVDQEPHRTSVLVVRWCGWATAAVALLLTLAVAPGWVALPWLALLLPLLLLGARLPFMPLHPPGGRHERQRVGAVAVVAALPFVALAALGATTPWVAAVAVLLVVAGLWQLVRDVPAGRGDLAEVAPDPDEAETPPTGLPPLGR